MDKKIWEYLYVYTFQDVRPLMDTDIIIVFAFKVHRGKYNVRFFFCRLKILQVRRHPNCFQLS